MRTTLIAVSVAGLCLIAGPAYAGGSDSPTPYSVTNEGITLPDGVTFQEPSVPEVTPIEIHPAPTSPPGAGGGAKAPGTKGTEPTDVTPVEIHPSPGQKGSGSGVKAGDFPKFPTVEAPVLAETGFSEKQMLLIWILGLAGASLLMGGLSLKLKAQQ